jgi:hypothetical protein
MSDFAAVLMILLAAKENRRDFACLCANLLGTYAIYRRLLP